MVNFRWGHPVRFALIEAQPRGGRRDGYYVILTPNVNGRIRSAFKAPWISNIPHCFIACVSKLFFPILLEYSVFVPRMPGWKICGLFLCTKCKNNNNNNTKVKTDLFCLYDYLDTYFPTCLCPTNNSKRCFWATNEDGKLNEHFECQDRGLPDFQTNLLYKRKNN